jgi:hypothetical protein
LFFSLTRCRGSPYINRFLQPDTLIPGVDSPQSWNRFSYVNNNPIRFNDPTGHYCVGDDEDCVDGGGGTGPVQTNSGGDGGCSGVPDCGLNENDVPVIYADEPLADLKQDKPYDNNYPTSSKNESDGAFVWILGMVDNYNYSVNSNNLPLYQYYSWMFDLEIRGQFGLVYANNSPFTISLDPTGLNLRHAYFRSSDGFSLNYGTSPSFGYSQSLPHNAISSITGINVNPVTGGIQSNLALNLYGPISYRQSVTINATVRPMESTAALIGGGFILTQLIPGRVDDAGLAIGTYKLCQATGICP